MRRLWRWFLSVIDTLEWDDCCQRLPTIPIHQHDPFNSWPAPAPEKTTITGPMFCNGFGSGPLPGRDVTVVLEEGKTKFIRPAPTCCRHEPPFPFHPAVMFCSNSDLVCHEEQLECGQEAPHALGSCGLFKLKEPGGCGGIIETH